MYEVEDLVEKPSPEEAPSEIAVMGRYVLNPSIFSVLKSIERGAGNEIQLTDALREACRTQPIHARLLEGKR
ncbi:UTP--glucose-1-phosphate uridylyltransferase [Bacillus atrophaeus]|nr:UTP--glucose-1-phosphate uridylyltransferase [Bacillus atrophaeus]